MGFLSRRRSFLLKLVVIVGTAWFTVAFLLYSENREPINSVQIPVQQVPVNIPIQEEPNPPAALKVDEKKEEKQYEDRIEQDNNRDDESNDKGVLQLPQEKFGELGKAVVLPANLSTDVKKIVDEGWAKNAFNQYVSDLISVRRELPDPRDEW